MGANVGFHQQAAGLRFRDQGAEVLHTPQDAHREIDDRPGTISTLFHIEGKEIGFRQNMRMGIAVVGNDFINLFCRSFNSFWMQQLFVSSSLQSFSSVIFQADTEPEYHYRNRPIGFHMQPGSWSIYFKKYPRPW